MRSETANTAKLHRKNGASIQTFIGLLQLEMMLAILSNIFTKSWDFAEGLPETSTLNCSKRLFLIKSIIYYIPLYSHIFHLVGWMKTNTIS